MEELIPFAKEMLSQRPSSGMLKVYLVGSAFALLGTVIGLVETVCHPFCSGATTSTTAVDPDHWNHTAHTALARAHKLRRSGDVKQEEEEEEEEARRVKQEVAETRGDGSLALTLSKTPTLGARSLANRLHAS